MAKNDHVKHEIYSKFLFGDAGKFNNNPTNDRVMILERMYRRILTELAANRFKWEGMPKSVDIRFMELTLFYRALSVFFYDDEYGQFFAMQGSGAGGPNMFNNPTHFRVDGPQFAGKRLSAVNRIIDDQRMPLECVPIWANYLRVPDLDIVLIYANKLAEIDRTIEINMKNARRTKVLVADENTRLSAVNINRQLDEGQSVIQVARPIDGMITAVDLGVHPDHIEKLHITRTRLWNECMGLMGIDNANQDKKERLVADEVDANTDQVMNNRAIALNARKTAAQQINDRWGLQVSVDYNTQIDSQMMSATDYDAPGNDDDEGEIE